MNYMFILLLHGDYIQSLSSLSAYSTAKLSSHTDEGFYVGHRNVLKKPLSKPITTNNTVAKNYK